MINTPCTPDKYTICEIASMLGPHSLFAAGDVHYYGEGINKSTPGAGCQESCWKRPMRTGRNMGVSNKRPLLSTRGARTNRETSYESFQNQGHLIWTQYTKIPYARTPRSDPSFLETCTNVDCDLWTAFRCRRSIARQHESKPIGVALA